MNDYSYRLTIHLKNQAKKLRRNSDLQHSEALDIAAVDFGFSGWKQARAHMDWVNRHLPLAIANFRSQKAALAEMLHVQKGYPYIFDEVTGTRYDPSVQKQCEGIAARTLLTQIFNEIYAPANAHSKNAKLWVRAVLPLALAQRRYTTCFWKLSRVANLLNTHKENRSTDLSNISPPGSEEVRDTLLEFLHVTFSLSVGKEAALGIEHLLSHPGFKEYSLHAVPVIREMSWAGVKGDLLIEHSGIVDWKESRDCNSDRRSLFWNDHLPPTILHSNSPRHFRSRSKPDNDIPTSKHADLAAGLDKIPIPSYGNNAIEKTLASIRETLASWMAQETGNPEAAFELYYQAKKANRTAGFLAPAQQLELKSRLTRIKETIDSGYSACLSKNALLKQLDLIEEKLITWITKTQHHWSQKNQKLLMDSIGLVAIDSKDEPHADYEALWGQVEMAGTVREENLVDALRPHLFEIWKAEDEAEGWPFDVTSSDVEESLREHIEDLSFYRYKGEARTKKQFLGEVRNSFYFEPMHCWFKQRLIL